jgi:hypothetical protein
VDPVNKPYDGFAAWFTAVGHLDAAAFQGRTSRELDQPIVDPLTGDRDAGLVTIQRGKGGRGRTIPAGPATAAAIRTYLGHEGFRKVAAVAGW